MSILITKEQREMIKSLGGEVITEKGDHYFFIPYYFQLLSDVGELSEVKVHHLDDLPEDLLQKLKIIRNATKGQYDSDSGHTP